jgi:hypothetical protein
VEDEEEIAGSPLKLRAAEAIWPKQILLNDPKAFLLLVSID